MIERLLNPVFHKLVHKTPLHGLDDLEKIQWKVLQSKLKLARHTTLAKKYSFNKITSVKEYQQAVPVHGYQDMKLYWDHEVHGKRKETIHGKIRYFARTSGTTGHIKLIPVTTHLIRDIKRIQLSFISEMLKYDARSKILTKKVLFISGSSNFGKTPGGHQIGLVSGIMRETVPSFFKFHILPSPGILNIQDKAARFEGIAKEISLKKIGLLLGIPLAIIDMLFYLRENFSSEEFSYFTHHLDLIFCSGTNYRPYADIIYNLLGKEVKIYDLYAASEGTFGHESLQNPTVMEFFYDNVFFEFIPADEFKAGLSNNRLLIHQLERGKSYALLVTTGNGAFSYSPGDIITCVDPAIPTFKITGRTSLELNLATEKTSVEAVEATITALSREIGEAPKEFFVTTSQLDGQFSYLWVFAKNQKWECFDPTWLRSKIDEALIKCNPHYGVILHRGIHPSRVAFIDYKNFDDWHHKRKADVGHRKVPRIITDENIVSALTGGALQYKPSAAKARSADQRTTSQLRRE